MVVNEVSYRNLVIDVLVEGTFKESRAGRTLSTHGKSVILDVTDNKLPLLTGRKMYPKGIIGEALAFLQTDCSSLEDFESRGCNYWKLWADEDGKLNLDYPIYDKLPGLIKQIMDDPYGRRHIIDLWNEDNLKNLSLPCCHYSYQFIVSGNYIDMIWTQRSADVMVGIPSDMVLATIYLNIVARETGYTPRKIVMNFGDAHIYEEHIDGAEKYLKAKTSQHPELHIAPKPYMELKPEDFDIRCYTSDPAIKFELKA